MKWFSIQGIKEEIKKTRWPKKDDMVKNSKTAISFIIVFAIYFVVCDFLVAQFLKIFGIGA